MYGPYRWITRQSPLTHIHRSFGNLGYCTAYKYMVEKKHYIPSTGFALINYSALSAALKSTPPVSAMIL